MTSQRSQSEPKRSVLRRCVRYGSASLLLGGTIVGTGCLDRPVGVSKPVTTNVVVERQVNNAINAIDLLLMIDNSSSMADKQSTLALAVPQLLTQLVQPLCTDANGNTTTDATGQTARVQLGSGNCPAGFSPEFNPVNNIHIGIVTSSLGDHGGGTLCTPGASTSFVDNTGKTLTEPDDVNDESHLMGTLTRYVQMANKTASYKNATVDPQGFLAWGDADKPAMSDQELTTATGIFTDMVTATHEIGCGLEAQLEGWFRFLVDPVPPMMPITRPNNADGTPGSNAARIGSDNALLAQRAAFLRPDSLVAILMLTDENDCSLRDTDVGWVATNTASSIRSGSAKCDTDPNDKCCYSCTAGAPSGCSDGCSDAAHSGNAKDDGSFQANIRCYHQKRRFGYEFMYPTSRYVVGLSKAKLCPDQSFGDMDCDCTFAKSIGAGCNPGSRTLDNPLYSNNIGTDNSNNVVQSADNTAMPRADNSVVFLAGIIGVPWQDVGYINKKTNVLTYIPVTDPSWTGTPTTADPSDPTGATLIQPITNAAPNNGIWGNIYGDDDQNTYPADPHMVESLVARPGIVANDNIEHEWNTAYEDLEYACIYPLPVSKQRKCACDSTSNDYNSCKYQNPNDCCDLTFQVDGEGGPPGSYNKPLCNGNTQINAKGYPGLREISVLHDYAVGADIKGNSIVASICPQSVADGSDTKSPGYGYNPAVAALVNRLKEKLKGSCLPRPLGVDATTHQVKCNVVEVVSGSVAGGDCTSYCQGHKRDVDLSSGQPVDVSSQMQSAVMDSLRQSNLCDANGKPACSSMCLCYLPQETNSGSTAGALDTCQSGDDAAASKLPPGFCYVDPALLDSNGNPIAGTNTDLVAKCPDTQKRIIRFAGNDPTDQATGGEAVPLTGALVFTACQGSALQSQ